MPFLPVGKVGIEIILVRLDYAYQLHEPSSIINAKQILRNTSKVDPDDCAYFSVFDRIAKVQPIAPATNFGDIILLEAVIRCVDALFGLAARTMLDMKHSLDKLRRDLLRGLIGRRDR